MRNSADINKDFGQMGFRIPAVGISPYLRRNHVAHTTYGFESILKMIEYRFGLKPLNKRDAYAQNIARSFDWESRPRLEVPDLPDPATVVSMACAPGSEGASSERQEQIERPNEHSVMELVTSGYLERLGFHFQPATAASTFREPSRVLSAYLGSGR
jgi:phospholipase C